MSAAGETYVEKKMSVTIFPETNQSVFIPGN